MKKPDEDILGVCAPAPRVTLWGVLALAIGLSLPVATVLWVIEMSF